MLLGPRLLRDQHGWHPVPCGEACDERTDIYSLGATYYALLTGRPPFEGATSLRIMFEHCSAPAPDPRNMNRHIPSECARIVQHAMAKKRVDRYCDARAMRDEVVDRLRIQVHPRRVANRDAGAPGRAFHTNRGAEVVGRAAHSHRPVRVRQRRFALELRRRAEGLPELVIRRVLH